MPFTQRPFSTGSDISIMIALANQCPADNLQVIDLPYRLSSWALDDPDNTRLWFDENGQLASWAVLQTPFWTVDMVCRPDVEPGLYPEMIAWTDRRARLALNTASGHPSWYVMAFSGQDGRLLVLKQAGFQCQSDAGEDSWSKVLMRRSAETPVKGYLPPSGYSVRPLDGESEVEAYVALHQAVFESKNMTAAWRSRTLLQPAYRPDLDLVVEAPDGRLAAFCICWLNENGRAGRIEPLGCHKDFRRFALGRVALAEGLHRLRSLGAKDVFVETDNYRNMALLLYKSFGFEVIQDVHVFRKDYNK